MSSSAAARGGAEITRGPPQQLDEARSLPGSTIGGEVDEERGQRQWRRRALGVDVETHVRRSGSTEQEVATDQDEALSCRTSDALFGQPVPASVVSDTDLGHAHNHNATVVLVCSMSMSAAFGSLGQTRRRLLTRRAEEPRTSG